MRECTHQYSLTVLMKANLPQLSKLLIVFISGQLCSCATGTTDSSDNPTTDPLDSTPIAMCIAQRGTPDLVPPNPFKTDGCTWWPESVWANCCVEHDIAYWCGGSSSQRSAADKRMQSCVAETGHPKTGLLMRLGVRLTGSRLLPTPWRWGYGWPWLSSMGHPESSP